METNKLKYISLNSTIHQANATIKILYLIVYGIICFLPNNIDFIVIASFLLATYLIISSKIPLSYYIKNIYRIMPIIIILLVILSRLQFTMLTSILIVLKVVFGVCLYALIIYTTLPFELAYSIYGILKYLNIFGIKRTKLFIWIYNTVLTKKDICDMMEKTIEGLEIKGICINNKTIISRFFIKLDLLPEVLRKVKSIHKKRKRVILKNGFDVNAHQSLVGINDILFLLMFITLITIYGLKVVG